MVKNILSAINSGFFQKNVPAFVCKGNKDFSKWVFLIGFILAYLPLNLLKVKNKGVKVGYLA
ncbi:MAG: hypothetical protein UIC63_03015 [Bacteroidaceae bacterium]|nr:hypothetical protein [Bacteroidaceae bacterium]